MTKKYKVLLAEEEKSIIIRSLVEMRNRLIEQGRYTDSVNDLLLKLIEE